MPTRPTDAQSDSGLEIFWEAGNCLELFVMFLGPFLSRFGSGSGLIAAGCVHCDCHVGRVFGL